MNAILLNPILLIILWYITGYLITLNLLKHFGKKIGLDFDTNPNEDAFDKEAKISQYSYWKSNVEAYTFFSLIWPLFWTINLIVVLGTFTYWILMPIWKNLKKLTNNIIN